MLYVRIVIAFAVLAFQGAAFAANAVLSVDYLLGTWRVGGVDACTAKQGSFVNFNANQTLEAGRGTAVTTVGFWRIGGDQVILHLLISPDPGREAHPFFQERYRYQYLAPRVLGLQADRIEYTQDTGVDAGVVSILTRCR